MQENPPPPSDPSPQQGISLDELTAAYANASEPQGEAAESDEAAEVSTSDKENVEGEAEDAIVESPDPLDDDMGEQVDPACELSPKTILEAMLFVGNRENDPLASQQAAALMRGVETSDIPELVNKLNSRYQADGCPYRIVSQGAGFQLVLAEEFAALRNVFYGRVREARLSQAAVEVLSAVAYRQPLTSEQVSGLRGTPSGHLLLQLVRRQLLRIERSEGKGRTTLYYTTDRFLELFGLESLDDMPQPEDPPDM